MPDAVLVARFGGGLRQVIRARPSCPFRPARSRRVPMHLLQRSSPNFSTSTCSFLPSRPSSRPSLHDLDFLRGEIERLRDCGSGASRARRGSSSSSVASFGAGCCLAHAAGTMSVAMTTMVSDKRLAHASSGESGPLWAAKERSIQAARSVAPNGAAVQASLLPSPRVGVGRAAGAECAGTTVTVACQPLATRSARPFDDIRRRAWRTADAASGGNKSGGNGK